ncbi:MAG: hypothetical protein U1D69_00765, partial [Polynucleobacter sp.]|nr:hypothetical protein [Polynucleobacter sp.]
LRFGGMKVRFIRSHVREQVPPEHIMLLQLLDALWDIDVLPATSSQQATQVLLGWVRKLSAAQRQALGRYALAYPPQTRALAGLLLETVGKNKRLVLQLQASLSPRIVFPLWLDLETFPTAPAWHFVSANGPRLPHHKPGTRTTF